MIADPAESRLDCAEQPGNLVFEANQAGRFLAVIEQGLIGTETRPGSVDDLWPEDIAQKVRQAFRRAVRGRASLTEFIELDNDARLELICVPQGPDRVLAIVRDRSARERALLDMQRIAYTDDVTGLPNREFLMSELERVVEHQRLRDGRLAVIVIYAGPLDDAGTPLTSWYSDRVLKEVARRLTVGLRNCNAMHGDGENFQRYTVLARMDHRHFGVVLPSIDSGVEVEGIVERLIGNISQPVTVDGRSVDVTTQGGIALFPQVGMSTRTLYVNAESALEDARQDGNESFRFHTGTVRLKALQRQDLEVELRSALAAGAMHLRYLPIVDAKTRQVRTFEALLRWPQDFVVRHSISKIVEFAERTGLILDLGDWVLRRAIVALQAWRRAGHEHIRLAINLSLAELVDESSRRRIRETLDVMGVPADSLDIEISERSLIRESSRDFQHCRLLKGLGMRIVVDDFGTSMNTVAQLAQSCADVVKIDRSLVSHIDSNDRDRRTTAAVIAMARELGMHVVAEGVEKESQASILESQGCRELQGFLFTQPIVEEQIPAFLETNAGRISGEGES